jgi:hypothetical protein
MSHLKKLGFDDKFLGETVIAFACDCAAVMLGAKNRVVTLH